MKKYNYLSFLIILIFFFTAPSNLFSNYKGKEKEGKENVKKPILQKTAVNPSQSLMNINNATMWVTEEGFHDWVVASGWNGAFPNGTTVGAIFAEGVVWGGQVNDGSDPKIRVNGNTYGTGCAPVTRLYRVRPDYVTGNLASDAASFNNIPIGSVTEADIQALREQYETDWNEWPADQGALFNDVNENGIYEPEIDIPGIPGASQTIFIKYDDRLSASNYGSPPIGLEVSETYWAYSYSGALGNVIYKKVDIVYKGTSTSASNSKIDSMYVVQWADPDVGNSTDDYAGCDTTLNLGYAYSSGETDGTYAGLNLAPPAAGYDFLQGVSVYTGNPSDSAIFNLKWRKGYKYVNRKPMSSYVYFAAGGTWSDPSFNYNGTLEFYNLMRGARPIPRYPSFSSFPDDVLDVSPDGGKFLLAGDPVTATGKIDGSVDGPGDRRIMVTNGPISMELGDTAQIVLALVYGLGTDNLSSITALKQNDLTAQIVFDQLFKLPSILPPTVSIANLDKKIVLNWGSDNSTIEKIENFSGQNYTFEGYEVYQLPSSSSSLENGILLGTFDLSNGVTAIYDTVIDVNGTSIPQLAADGKDTELKRFLNIEEDKIRGTALRNGQEYYFAVVSYAQNPSPLLPFHVLRSPFIVVRAVPQTPLPGNSLPNDPGDILSVSHSEGKSDGSVTAIVIDPTQLNGHSYEVTFKDVDGSTVWDVTDVTLSPPVIKASNQVNQGGGDDYPIIDGIQIKVEGPPLLGLDFSSTGPRWLSGNSANGGELMFGAAFLGPNFWGETTVAPGDLKDLHVDAFKVSSYVDANSNGKYDIGEIYTVDPANGQIANLYSTWGAGNWKSSTLIPFKFFDVTSDPPRQLSVIVRDRDGNGQWDPDDGENTPYNYLFVLDSDYDPTGNNWNPTAGGRDFMDEILVNGGPVLWTFWWVPRGTREQFAADFTMDFIAPKVNTAADKFSFTANKTKFDAVDLMNDVKKVNVFPNPYYGFQSRETSPTNKYVTFSHLPSTATIRIFDISGVLVKTINHLPSSGQFDTWNLQNDNNLPVASGIYIVYVDMPEVGTTKVLKLAVIQEQQILKVY